jgi:hypothetical protein
LLNNPITFNVYFSFCPLLNMRPLHFILPLLVLLNSAAIPAVSATAEKWIGELPLVAREGSRKEMVYYVWDAGDGRLFPSARGFATGKAELTVPVRNATAHSVTWTAVGTSGWTHTGEARNARPLNQVTDPGTSLGMRRTWTTHLAENLQSRPGQQGFRHRNPFEESTLSIELDGLAAIEWLVLRRGEDMPFPYGFRLHSALSADGPWYPVVSAHFDFFPEPGDNEVWIPLRGLNAAALRIAVTRMHPLATESESYGWELGAVRVLGKPAHPFTIESSDTADTPVWNNLWWNFGLAVNEVHQRFDPWWETDRPLEGGMVCIGSCEWLHWGSLKLSWLGDHPQSRRLEQFIAGNPVDEDGMVWAAPNSAKHLGHSVHFVNNAIYPMAVAQHYLMRRDPAFLDKPDPRTGETILSKARRAMEYQLNQLEGRSGLVRYTGPEHDGTPGSKGTNYWDFWLFGNHCAYGNAFFYESLRLFGELEEALGDAERAGELRKLRPLVRKRYNETFWNEQAGRYVGWICVEGIAYDYGFPFVNTKALAFGLPTASKGRSVLDWLQGRRIVESDTSQGKDIYHFGFAARVNTLDARVGEPIGPVNTWNGALDVNPGGNAAFGQNNQNGGSIFYVSYYDLHGRRNYGGTRAVEELWSKIRHEFNLDQLRRIPANNEGISHVLGILREFPESGLIPYFLVDGIVGIHPVAAGMRIEPALPESWQGVAIESLGFAGKHYQVIVSRDFTGATIDGTTLRIPAEGKWLLTTKGDIITTYNE